ncbi:hypothetical protein COLO4_33397 [Corchorus olitorius]|uniref:Uncharacterized protein n=1 Tax=Corchorus olitorius TaxID=93759 RepID=A0A1R3GU95_9ROSI|nr:hypothetical protein COLO4_33397 [Corchorus olitorius]
MALAKHGPLCGKGIIKAKDGLVHHRADGEE